MSAAQEIGAPVKAPRRRKAIAILPEVAIGPLPSAATNDGIVGHRPAARKGHSSPAHESDVQLERAAVARLLASIDAQQKIRTFCIKSQSRCDRSMEALIASSLGYVNALSEKERKELFRRAAAIREAVEKGGDVHSIIARDGQFPCDISALYPLILANAAARKLFDDRRDAAEKAMRQMARQLPVWSAWAKDVRGFGELGLALIVAEAGKTHDLGAFSSKEKLWLMLGLAVFNGERQQRKTSKSEAELHRFSPRRRAEIWVIGDVLLRQQWAGDKTEKGGEPAHPTGPYGEVYARRRAHTEPRVAATADLPYSDRNKWTPMRCKNDAVRIMTKRLVRDLWREWRKVTPRTVETE